MTIICETCHQPIDYNKSARHRRDCSSDSNSEIALVEPEDESKPTNRWGEEHEKRTHPFCRVCEQDVFKCQLEYHKGQCRDGKHSEIGVAKDGTAPRCAYCSQKVEPPEFEEHTRLCGISNTDSEHGVGVED